MKYVFPVIHHLDWETTYTQAAIAFNHDADGVFLISHRGDDLALLELAQTIARQHLRFVGINMLHYDAVAAYHFASGIGINAMWCDDPGVTSGSVTSIGNDLRRLYQQKLEPAIFASVAFKYQAPEPDPALAAKNARAFGYIPTTSGPGTGQAPDVEKIRIMSEAVGGELAIASGMTPENVSQFLPYVKYFLVSTGISKDEYHLDEEKLAKFVEVCRAF